MLITFGYDLAHPQFLKTIEKEIMDVIINMLISGKLHIPSMGHGVSLFPL